MLGFSCSRFNILLFTNPTLQILRLDDVSVISQTDIHLIETQQSLVRVAQIREVLDAVSEHQGIDPDDLTRSRDNYLSVNAQMIP